MTKYTNINGVDFETIKSSKTQNMIDYHMKYFMHRDLYFYYEKPSDIKREIYLKWLKWYLDRDNTVTFFEVINGSPFNFSIGAILLDEYNEPIGYIKITKCHNYLYLIK